jgi:NAD(P)-dependent dehydrogenase (short-subunit alcohol dehydrogenase family)
VAAREWGRFGIRVNVVCPFADSPASLAFNETRPEAAAAVLQASPLGRMVTARKTSDERSSRSSALT